MFARAHEPPLDPALAPSSHSETRIPETASISARARPLSPFCFLELNLVFVVVALPSRSG